MHPTSPIKHSSLHPHHYISSVISFNEKILPHNCHIQNRPGPSLLPKNGARLAQSPLSGLCMHSRISKRSCDHGHNLTRISRVSTYENMLLLSRTKNRTKTSKGRALFRTVNHTRANREMSVKKKNCSLNRP